MLDKRARCFAPYLVRNRTTHGNRELPTSRAHNPRTKKGAGASPLFLQN
jgi:hypothetical protein